MDKLDKLLALLSVVEGVEDSGEAPAKDAEKNPEIKIYEGSMVIVRSNMAGVLYGVLKAIDGDTVHLGDARQLWQWHAKEGISLVDVAHYGVIADKCKFSNATAHVIVMKADAVIYTTPEARASIEAV